MTITLEIRPEAEAALRHQARSKGRGLEAFVASLLEDAARLPADDTANLTGRALIDASAKVRGLFTDEEIHSMFRREPSAERPINFE